MTTSENGAAEARTIKTAEYGHGSIRLTAYTSSRRIWVETSAENSVMDWSELFEFADRLRKPRAITTIEELNALPVGSVILDPAGLSLHRNAFTGWSASNGAKEISLDMLEREALPATVLHEPTA